MAPWIGRKTCAGYTARRGRMQAAGPRQVRRETASAPLGRLLPREVRAVQRRADAGLCTLPRVRRRHASRARRERAVARETDLAPPARRARRLCTAGAGAQAVAEPLLHVLAPERRAAAARRRGDGDGV